MSEKEWAKKAPAMAAETAMAGASVRLATRPESEIGPGIRSPMRLGTGCILHVAEFMPAPGRRSGRWEAQNAVWLRKKRAAPYPDCLSAGQTGLG